MKSSLTPINLAVDSVALFLAMLAWAFLVWAPLLLAFALFFMTKTSPLISLLILLFVTSILLLLGFLLRWLAHGVIQRKWARTGLSVLILGLWGIKQGLSPLLLRNGSARRTFENPEMGIALICAAAVAALGLTKHARRAGE